MRISWLQSGCHLVGIITIIMALQGSSSAFAAMLTVQATGTGNGTIHSSPSGIACPGGCTGDFTSVMLYATPASDSLFSGWGGACAGREQCSLSLTSATSVSGLFTLKSTPIRVSGSYYGALQNAYNGVAADGAILATAEAKPGDLTFDRDIPVAITGGYDSTFTSVAADTFTTINGSVTVVSGTVSLAHLIVGPAVSATPLAAPTALVATAGNGLMVVSWDAVDGATSYNVYYGTDPGVTRDSGIKVSGSSTVTSMVVTGLTNGATYYVVVTAVSAAGESVESAQIIVAPVASSSVYTAPYAVSVAESASSYNAADVITSASFPTAIQIDFSANTAQSSTGTAQEITTDGVTLITDGDAKLIVTKTTNGITITSTLTSPVSYALTGNLGGTLTVSSSAAYQLYLEGVAITATAGPALDLESTQKAFITLAAGTTNRLVDAATRTLTMKAALYSKGALILNGTGSLTVTGSYKHGIFSNDYIRIRGGVIAVSTSVKDAIRSVNGFIFDDGDLTVAATGTTTGDEGKGIKVEGSETSGTGKGFIVINGGHLTVNSVGKAISAGWDIDEDATTTSTADDPTPYVIINNGVITITTTGTPYEYVSNGTTVSCSPEGIEAKTDLTINNGYIIISTTDDGINAGTSLTINGGYIYSASSVNDAIDSNGSLTITGGVIVAVGATLPEAALDCDQNTFAISGGTFVGIAGSTSMPTSSVCSQNTVILGSGSNGVTMGLKSTDGSTAFAFLIPQTYTSMIMSSPKITTGTTYSVYTGGAASGDTIFKGLYLGNLSYTGGAAGTGFTVSTCVTKLTSGGGR